MSIIDVKGILGNTSLLSVMIHLVKGKVPQSRKTEAATGCVLLKKVLLKISKNSQENSVLESLFQQSCWPQTL